MFSNSKLFSVCFRYSFFSLIITTLFFEASSLAGGTDCLSVLTRPDELRIVNSIGDLNKIFFNSKLTVDQRDEQFEGIVRAINPENDKKKEGEIKLKIAMQNDEEAARQVFPMLMDYLIGNEITQEKRGILVKFGVSENDIETYLKEASAVFAPFYMSMLANKISYNPEMGWDFMESELNVDSIKKDPTFFTALTTFFSLDFAQKLSDPSRKYAIAVGHQIFLPPLELKVRKNAIDVMSVEDYKEEVSFKMERLQASSKEFFEASQEASSYSNLVMGRYVESVFVQGFAETYLGMDPNGPEFKRGATDADIRYAESVREVAFWKNQLFKRLGIPQIFQDALLADLSKAYSDDMENFEAGSNKVLAATIAIPAAATVVGLLYLAPMAITGVAATGMVSLPVATFAASSVATFALIPLAFGATSAVINASVDYANNGGDWFCYFREEMATKGADSLYVAPFMEMIPLGAAAGAGLWGAGAHLLAGGTLIGETGLVGSLVAAKSAAAAYATINFGVAAYFVYKMGSAGVTELSTCLDFLNEAKAESKKSGDLEIINSLANQAWKTCLQGGIDIGFALGGGWRMGAEGYKGFKTVANPNGEPIVDYYEALGVNRNASQAEIKEAYRTLAKKYHPDAKNGDAEMFRLVVEANKQLGDPYTRRIYDIKLGVSKRIFRETATAQTTQRSSEPTQLLNAGDATKSQASAATPDESVVTAAPVTTPVREVATEAQVTTSPEARSSTLQVASGPSNVAIAPVALNPSALLGQQLNRVVCEDCGQPLDPSENASGESPVASRNLPDADQIDLADSSVSNAIVDSFKDGDLATQQSIAMRGLITNFLAGARPNTELSIIQSFAKLCSETLPSPGAKLSPRFIWEVLNTFSPIEQENFLDVLREANTWAGSRNSITLKDAFDLALSKYGLLEQFEERCK